MLVNCPRCGFSQPKDQYCAQCGIDMQSFKPKEIPLLNKILSNAGLQIALLFIAAIFVGQYIFHSQEPQSWVQKITHFKGFNKSAKAAGTSRNTSDDFNSDTETETATSSSRAEKDEVFHNREFSTKNSADNATAAAIAPAGQDYLRRPELRRPFKGKRICHAELSGNFFALRIEPDGPRCAHDPATRLGTA